MTPVFRKLGLKDRKTIVVLSPPAEFEPELAALDSIRVLREMNDGTAPAFLIAFLRSRQEIDALAERLRQRLEGDPVLWFAYPKAASKKYRADFNRDSGWAVMGTVGLEPVSQVSINDDWSALRFRRVDHIRTMKRHPDGTLTEEGRRRTLRDRE